MGRRSCSHDARLAVALCVLAHAQSAILTLPTTGFLESLSTDAAAVVRRNNRRRSSAGTGGNPARERPHTLYLCNDLAILTEKRFCSSPRKSARFGTLSRIAAQEVLVAHGPLSHMSIETIAIGFDGTSRIRLTLPLSAAPMQMSSRSSACEPADVTRDDVGAPAPKWHPREQDGTSVQACAAPRLRWRPRWELREARYRACESWLRMPAAR